MKSNMFKVQSDISKLKDRYSEEDRRHLLEVLVHNCSTYIYLGEGNSNDLPDECDFEQDAKKA